MQQVPPPPPPPPPRQSGNSQPPPPPPPPPQAVPFQQRSQDAAAYVPGALLAPQAAGAQGAVAGTVQAVAVPAEQLTQLQLAAQRALPAGGVGLPASSSSLVTASSNSSSGATVVTNALPVWGPTVQLTTNGRGSRAVSAKNPFAGMPRHLRNAQLRRNLCGIAEALRDQPLMAAPLMQQQQQQQQVAVSSPAPGFAAITAAGSYSAQQGLQVEGVTAGSSGGSLRASWEAGPDLLSSSVSDNSSGRLPHMPWADNSGSTSMPLLQNDLTLSARLAAGGGAAAALPSSDLIRLGSLTDAALMQPDSGLTVAQQAAAAVAAGRQAQPPPPPPRSSSHRQQLLLQQQQQAAVIGSWGGPSAGGLPARLQRMSLEQGLLPAHGPAAAAAAAAAGSPGTSSFDGITLLQLEQLQLQQHQQLTAQLQQSAWLVDPDSCLLAQQQQQHSMSAASSVVRGGGWSDPSGSSRATSSRGPSIDSRPSRGPSIDSRPSFDSRLSFDSRGTGSRGTSFEVNSNFAMQLRLPAAAAAPAGSSMGAHQLSPQQMQQQAVLLVSPQGPLAGGQSPAAAAAAAAAAAQVATLEQHIQQVELALALAAEEQQQQQQQQQQQLAAMSEHGLSMGAAAVSLQRTPSAPLNRRLSLNPELSLQQDVPLLSLGTHLSVGGTSDMSAPSLYNSLGDMPNAATFYSANSSLAAGGGAAAAAGLPGGFHSEPLPGLSAQELTLAHFLQQQQQQQQQGVDVRGGSPLSLPDVSCAHDLTAGGRLSPSVVLAPAAAAAAAGGEVSATPANTPPLPPSLQQQQQQQQEQRVLGSTAGDGGSGSGGGGGSSGVSQHVAGLLRQHAALSALQQELQQELRVELQRLLPLDQQQQQ